MLSRKTVERAKVICRNGTSAAWRAVLPVQKEAIPLLTGAIAEVRELSLLRVIPERVAARFHDHGAHDDLLLHIGHTTTVAKMWSLLSWASIALLASQAQALYFYIDGPSQKCFFEELPKDTLVVGMMGQTHCRTSA